MHDFDFCMGIKGKTSLSALLLAYT